MIRKQDKRLSSMLNKRVEVWHTVKSTVKDRLGQYPQEDELYRTAYAGVIPQTGSLLSGRTADTTLSRTTHKIVTTFSISWIRTLTMNGLKFSVRCCSDG